ncbi:malectin-A-like [Ruditapes philippinarum]|uniref:malectin-A-like n=1 Tax=Ruditapes philippinarum TaxID=129788 RepID=UPI00295BC6CD|nr:malectin-A-like [Ruditapes philippinarum]
MILLSMIGNIYSTMQRSSLKLNTLLSLLFSLSLFTNCMGIGEVIWAVNCGGEAHTDIHGIRYQEDNLQVGISSDYGKSLMIQRVVPQDQILYQTERYNMNTFGYTLPLTKDGNYVLVLKFSEVWFTSPGQKVFDVMLNGHHTISHDLDIYAKVGRGVAHDEIVPFQIHGGQLKVNGETSDIVDGKLIVEFVKADYDNPKINAMYVMRGTVDDVPKLPPLQGLDGSTDEEEEEEEEVVNDSKQKQNIRPSGPKVKDPYSTDDTSTMLLPVFVAVGAFIPLLFCLCKL